MDLLEEKPLLVLLYMIGLGKVCAQTKKISKLKTKPEGCPFSDISTQSMLDHIHFRSETNKNKTLSL